MKKIDLGQAVTILANLGVIAGIVFLAFELRQNNQLMQAEAISTVLESRTVRHDQLIGNPALVEAVTKNGRNEALSPEESMVLASFYRRRFLGWQRDFLLYQQGILNEELLRITMASMRRSFGRRDETISVADAWNDEWKGIATEGFRDFVDQCVLSDCETISR